MRYTPTYSYRDGQYRRDGEPIDVLDELVELTGQVEELEARLAVACVDEPQPEYCDCDGFHDGSCRTREMTRLRAQLAAAYAELRALKGVKNDG